MITSFKIENFRCFSQTKATGLGRVNLIDGQCLINKKLTP